MPAIEEWLQWKETCALALCEPAIQSVLKAFVHARSSRYAAQYIEAFQAGTAEVYSSNPRETWHWFETYFQLRQNRQGKAYKQWLFARTGGKTAPDSEDIESGVSLLLRDVVRDRLRSEHSPRRVLSLDANVGTANAGAPVTIKELLPDECDTENDVERREIEQIAASLADSILASLNSRERIALLARELGISVADPRVLRVAGCGKSALAEAYRSALVAVAQRISAAYPAESRATQAALTIAAFEIIRQRVISTAGAEKGLSGFLSIEGRS